VLALLGLLEGSGKEKMYLDLVQLVLRVSVLEFEMLQPLMRIEEEDGLSFWQMMKLTPDRFSNSEGCRSCREERDIPCYRGRIA
jgi:hypothetical protein